MINTHSFPVPKTIENYAQSSKNIDDDVAEGKGTFHQSKNAKVKENLSCYILIKLYPSIYIMSTNHWKLQKKTL